MIVIRSIKQMREFSRRIKAQGQTIGFVPTMGALHSGHASLIKQARQENGKIAVSIFVNPAQFGPKEDFKRYPRSLKQDTDLCRKEGVDIIFYPSRKDMYPANYKTYVFVEGLSDILCGKLRPGHFRGVATIVTKLFNIVSPDIAYFGQKDAQQAIIIKKMAEDLNMPVKIQIMPTVREKGGLALSSRNIYLNQDERKDALVLCQALNLAKNLIRQGNTNSLDITRKMRKLINSKRNVCVQYVSIADLQNLKPVSKINSRVLIALAVYIGKTRLIDNIIVTSKLVTRN